MGGGNDVIVFCEEDEYVIYLVVSIVFFSFLEDDM